MYKPIPRRKSDIVRNEAVQGETIEMKVRRALNNGEGISDHAQVIYTERKDGVLPEYNIRTDKWEIAAEAMNKVTADNQARRKANIVKMTPKIDDNDTGKTGE